MTTKQISYLFCCCCSLQGLRELTFAQESLLMTPERHQRSPSEIERLINTPLTGLGLKVHTHTCTRGDALVCARVHYCWYNMLYVISAQPPVYVKGDNKRHMNSNKAQPQSINSSSSQSQHCNLKPLFESSVCACVCLCVCVCARTCTCVCVQRNNNQFFESIICKVGLR